MAAPLFLCQLRAGSRSKLLAAPGHTCCAASRKINPTIGAEQSWTTHTSPHTRGVSVSHQVRPTTVAPWSFRAMASSPGRRVRTRALRFVASACIPTGKLQRQRRHVSARTSCYPTSCKTRQTTTAQPHYRQAKQNSRNLSNITTQRDLVNQSLPPRAVAEFRFPLSD